MDCMKGMAQFPDKYFDLAIVDPPYGIGDKLLKGGKTGTVKFHERYEAGNWDDKKPDKNYFDELFRISSNQVIWGGNYFDLPPTRGIICWDKLNGHPYNFSHWEMGWTSYSCIARKIEIFSNTGNKIHPTQKPVQLYKWILHNYAKPDMKIIDTHVGSASSIIAFLDFGCDWIGFEIDKDYYSDGSKRIEIHKKRPKPFFSEIEISKPLKRFFDK